MPERRFFTDEKQIFFQRSRDPEGHMVTCSRLKKERRIQNRLAPVMSVPSGTPFVSNDINQLVISLQSISSHVAIAMSAIRELALMAERRK